MKKFVKIVKIDTEFNISTVVAQRDLNESLNQGWVITHTCDSYIILQKEMDDQEYEENMLALKKRYDRLTDTRYE